MDRVPVRMAWGILLILLGVLFLLQIYGVIPTDLGWIWALLFAVAGIVFLYVFFANHVVYWWAIIPAFTLLGLAVTVALALVGEALAPLGGTVFLGAIGLSFLVVYLNNRLYWWAIIPAGSLLTLAVVAVLGVYWQGAGPEIGAIFFLGLGLTFLLLYFVPTEQGQLRWAVIPAIVLLTLALVVVATTGRAAGFVLPLVLIALGLWLLLRGNVLRRGV